MQTGDLGWLTFYSFPPALWFWVLREPSGQQQREGHQVLWLCHWNTMCVRLPTHGSLDHKREIARLCPALSGLVQLYFCWKNELEEYVCLGACVSIWGLHNVWRIGQTVSQIDGRLSLLTLLRPLALRSSW